MNTKRILAAVATLALPATLLITTPAHASRVFNLQTTLGGDHSGRAVGNGAVIWHSAQRFSIKVNDLADHCNNGAGDTAGAYIRVMTQSRLGTSTWFHTGAKDTSQCGDGDTFSGTVGPFPQSGQETIKAVKVQVIECNGPADCSTNALDFENSDWKWNPNR